MNRAIYIKTVTHLQPVLIFDLMVDKGNKNFQIWHDVRG
jgi:hypothetical protein